MSGDNMIRDKVEESHQHRSLGSHLTHTLHQPNHHLVSGTQSIISDEMKELEDAQNVRLITIWWGPRCEAISHWVFGK